MSVIAKLKIKSDQPFTILNLPGECRHLFEEAEFTATVKDTASQLLLFAVDSANLAQSLSLIAEKIAPDAGVWVAFPKKSSGLKTDLSRDNGWDALHGLGYAPVSLIAIDDTWSALRFKQKEALKDAKRDIPMAERQVEGIDFSNRTVVLPGDAFAALSEFEGLVAFFNSMSFTHKKEYVEAIVEAKKPETRQKRIDKMIEMVIRLRDQKEAKKKK